MSQLEYSQVDLARMARTFRELDSPRHGHLMGVIAARTEYSLVVLDVKVVAQKFQINADKFRVVSGERQ